MDKLEKPNGLVVRIVNEDGGSYVYLYDMIGERVIGNGLSIGHGVYGTMPLSMMIFVHYEPYKSGVVVQDIIPVEVNEDILNIMKNHDFIPLVEEVYIEIFELGNIDEEIRVASTKENI